MGLAFLVFLVQIALSSSSYQVQGRNQAQIGDKHINSPTEANNSEQEEFDGHPHYRILQDLKSSST